MLSAKSLTLQYEINRKGSAKRQTIKKSCNRVGRLQPVLDRLQLFLMAGILTNFIEIYQFQNSPVFKKNSVDIGELMVDIEISLSRLTN